MDDLAVYGRQIGLAINETAEMLFNRYLEELLYWNQRINLTRIVEPEDIVIKHFYDSLTCLKVLNLSPGEPVLDVGSGAGFPGIPLRILQPIKLTVLDSSQKKVKFLQNLCSKLGFTNVEAIHGRAEDLGRTPQFREKFSVVVARAVARLDILAELCLPFVAIGGEFLAQKGPEAGAELELSNHAIALLGGRVEKVEKIILPQDKGERQLILVKKIKNSPERFPRRSGIPEKKPLGN